MHSFLYFRFPTDTDLSLLDRTLGFRLFELYASVKISLARISPNSVDLILIFRHAEISTEDERQRPPGDRVVQRSCR